MRISGVTKVFELLKILNGYICCAFFSYLTCLSKRCSMVLCCRYNFWYNLWTKLFNLLFNKNNVCFCNVVVVYIFFLNFDIDILWTRAIGCFHLDYILMSCIVPCVFSYLYKTSYARTIVLLFVGSLHRLFIFYRFLYITLSLLLYGERKIFCIWLLFYYCNAFYFIIAILITNTGTVSSLW